MSLGYHINPDTGNANKCGAQYKCKFDFTETEHYDTKEEAQAASEEILESQFTNKNTTTKLIKNGTAKYDYDNNDFNPVSYYLTNIREWKETEWTKNEEHNFLMTRKIVDLLDKDDVSQEDIDKARKIFKKFHSRDYKINWQSNRFGTGIVNNAERRDQNIINLAQSVIEKRQADIAPAPEPAPQRDVNDRIIGLREAQLENFRKFNEPGYSWSKGEKTIGDSAESYFDQTLDRIVDGEDFEDQIDDHNVSYYNTPKHDRVMLAIGRDNQLYLSTAFLDNELKKSMDYADVSNVSVTSFYNAREWGNAYTVIDADGGTRTFSIYEHRNTDSIIINGKENWDGKELPYAGDDKNYFFAEFTPEDREQAADALTFYMKSAQNGNLESDVELVNSASKRDWAGILNDQIPGFGEWYEKDTGKKIKKQEDKTDDEILKDLDFGS